jgi:hypothetical protein
MKNVISVLIIVAFAVTLVGSAYAHKGEVIGDYKIEVGWKDEPPIVGQKNAIEIIVTIATEQDKESHESDESEEHTEDEEHESHEDEHMEETNTESMEHDESKESEMHDEEHTEYEKLEPGTAVTGLSDKLEVTVSLEGQKTTLILVESSKPGVYHADYTPAEVGFPLVNLVGKIDHEEFEITFHPEKVEPLSALSPLSQIHHGIDPTNVQCKEGLELFMRTNGSVACLSSTTAQVLISRGWELSQI